MLLCPSRILLRNYAVWEQPTRCLFGFGKRKKNPEPSSLKAVSDKDDGLKGKVQPGIEIHEISKEQKELNELPIKVIPPDGERRRTWLAQKAILFYVPRRKCGYVPEYEMEVSGRAALQGFKYFGEELKKWWKEITDLDVMKEFPVQHGNTDKVFQFNSAESLKDWVVTADSDHFEGYSTVDFSFNKNGRAVFSGELSTRLPKDGRLKFAGYVNVRSPQQYRSFYELKHYNWICYNSVELRIRGDGRSYMFNLHSPGTFDTLMDDMFSYPLYTRGGPYWQTVRIPFAKFIFSNKGRVQDIQYDFPRDQIHFVSITLMDNTDGPFKLEIDYIGAVHDTSYDEERAYEEYTVPNLMVQN